MTVKASSIKLPVDLIDRLRALRKSHQAIAGVIEDLITASESKSLIISPEVLSRLEGYRTHPRETVEDLIAVVLDELEIKVDNLIDG